MIEEFTTEEKIKQAAAKVFIKKGFAATRTRDIAEEAGINVASLHYYYRSKDRLFEFVIGDAMRRFSAGMDEIFGSEGALEEKIKEFVHRYIDFFKANPYIPLFIMSESQTNPEKIDKMLNDEKSLISLKNQLKKLADQGVIHPIHPAHFFLNIISMTAFPFLAKPIMMKKLDLQEKDYESLLEERKKIIPEMIINHLFIEKKE